MDKKEIGEMIKMRREEEKVTQEELCIGICTASTLLRIESGKFSSNTGVLTRLLERLGLSADYLREATNDEDYIVRQKIRDINHVNISGDKEKARAMLDELGADYENFSVENRQRYDVMGTKMLHEEGAIDTKTRLSHLEDSLRLTIPNYSESKLPKYMTNMEAQILRDIADTYGELQEYEHAINILQHIKDNYEKHAVDKSYSAKRLVDICYNLSKCLGLAGRYSESIQIAKDGINYCDYVSNLSMISSCMYNCAWSLSRRNNYGDKEEAKKLANEALSLCTPKVWNSEELKQCLNRLLKEIDSQ
ncbi:MAG: helix-turn-helix domain-containing protein [Oscillospiraceae bacterium]|nr:helix-turn-helix domain-containing protein [Oscillospiraceae bacterium]